VKNALQVVGFSGDEIRDVMSIVAGILHLGNVTFSSQNDKYRKPNLFFF
jgi:myosin heavy subunit